MRLEKCVCVCASTSLPPHPARCEVGPDRACSVAAESAPLCTAEPPPETTAWGVPDLAPVLKTHTQFKSLSTKCDLVCLELQQSDYLSSYVSLCSVSSVYNCHLSFPVSASKHKKLLRTVPSNNGSIIPAN